VTREQFSQWKELKETKEYYELLLQMRDTVYRQLISNNTSELLQRDSGKGEILDYLLNLDCDEE
jgi:hypothetical protein